VAGEGDGSCELVNGREGAAGESSDGEWTMGKLRHSRLATHVTWNGTWTGDLVVGDVGGVL